MTSDCVVLTRKTQAPRQSLVQTTQAVGLFALFAGPRAFRTSLLCSSSGLLKAPRAGGFRRKVCRPRELGSFLWGMAVLDSPRSSDGTALLDPFTDLRALALLPGLCTRK